MGEHPFQKAIDEINALNAWNKRQARRDRHMEIAETLRALRLLMNLGEKIDEMLLEAAEFIEKRAGEE